MQIKIWTNFSKRVNSTKQPTGGTTVDVLLKNETDVLQPVFILNNLDFSINYCQAFGHYYFVQVTNLDGHRSELHCSLDHLATFKTQISGYRGLIEFTSSSSDVTITDPRNHPTLVKATKYTTISLAGFSFQDTVGCYIVGILSDTADGTSGVCSYYAMFPGQLQTLAQHLYDGNLWTALQNQIYGVNNAIVSCHWLPIPVTDISGTSEKIHIGSEELDTYGKKISSRILGASSSPTTIDYPISSDGAGASMNYLSAPPFATLECYLPFIGYVPLSDDLFASDKSIHMYCFVDVLTGDIVYQIWSAAGPIASFNGSCATKMPISSAAYDGIGVASGMVTAIGGAAGTAIAAAAGAPLLAVGAAAGAALSGAFSSTIKSTQIQTMISGTNSSALGSKLGLVPVIIAIQSVPEIAEADLLSLQAAHGMPYYKVATISSLSGYVKCADASVSIPGDGAEQDTVNNYLNSGFYYE